MAQRWHVLPANQLGNRRSVLRQISEYKGNDSERGRVLWRNDAKQMTRRAASSDEGQTRGGELMGRRIAVG